MLRNYFKIVIRTIAKNKTYSFLNVFGLAIGLSCCLLTLIYVIDELSFDNGFPNEERMFRIVQNGNIGGNKFNTAYTPAPMADALLDEFSQVESVTRIRGSIPNSESTPIQLQDQVFMEPRVYYGDSNAIAFFGIHLIQGNPLKALSLPNSVVITQQTAERYFKDQDPIGRSLKFVDINQDLVVTGVADPFPANTHFHFDFLATFSSIEASKGTRWIGAASITYFKVKEGQLIEDLSNGLPLLFTKYVAPQMQDILGLSLTQFLNEGGTLAFQTQAVKDIHLSSSLDNELEHNSSWTFIYVYSSIASLILLLAAINFINITTSRASGRAKEIGLRKVFGSVRNQLVRQFLVESVLISICAYLLAIVIAFLALPFVNDLLNKEYAIADLFNPKIISLFFLIAFVVGIISGLYPSFFLSSFEPVLILKGLITKGKKGMILRNGLVIVQYTIATTLLICTLIVLLQVRYMKNKELGFNKDQVLVLQNANALGEKQDYFQNELKSNSSIVDASYSSSLPGNISGKAVFKSENESISAVYSTVSVDENFFNVYGINLAAGRNFTKEHSKGKVIVNEAAVKNLRWKEPLAKRFNPGTPDVSEVVGVVKNFNFESLHEAIQPIVIAYKTEDDRIKYLSIKIRGQNMDETIAAIRSKWMEVAPAHPFNYFFFDEHFNTLYKDDEKLGRAIIALTIIATVVASLGLFGMVFFVVNERVKEIGIRKVLGSSVSQITMLVNKEIIGKVMIAAFAAWPLSYFIVLKWLEGFAYRIPVSIAPFVAASALTVLIALATIAYQTLSAARANPIDTLRNP